jgi:hypothetical protein
MSTTQLLNSKFFKAFIGKGVDVNNFSRKVQGKSGSA